MVKLKFVLMLLVLTLMGFGGWGYNMYQLQIVQNNNAAMAAELEELRSINAEQKRLADLVEADMKAKAEKEAAAEANFKRMTRNNHEVVELDDLPELPMGWDY